MHYNAFIIAVHILDTMQYRFTFKSNYDSGSVKLYKGANEKIQRENNQPTHKPNNKNIYGLIIFYDF